MSEKQITPIGIDRLMLSRFNPRKNRPEEDVESLTRRIVANGFEVTRALWVRPVEDVFEVFAGGTRYEAARRAGLTEIPCVVYPEVSDEDVVRLADVDNENDEYHAPVPLLDVWAECYRLNKEEGWSQERIAAAKGGAWDQPAVARRVRFHLELPGSAREAVCNGLLEEGHCTAIMSLVCNVTYLEPWLTTDSVRSELVASLLDKTRGKSTGDSKITVKNIRARVKEWQTLIKRAVEDYESLGEEWGPKFVALLAKQEVRTLAKSNECFQVVLRQKQDEARKAKDEAQKKEDEAAAEAARAYRIEQLTSRIVLGDARETVETSPPAHLLLTDPPYGQDFQSGRRKSTVKKGKIDGDLDPVAAASLLGAVLASAPLEPDAHVLVFTGWRHEPLFREAILDAGFDIKGSLVWVKNNHGTGDLKGSFAPKHERIIHAVRGKPELSKRIPDVVEAKDKQNSEHPTEKPIALLKKLIEATTYKHQTVVDPFAGSGSTLFAALEMERDFWGCEIDPDNHKKISDRLYEIANEEAEDGV